MIGSAGQSLGVVNFKVTIELAIDANDYVGKGLSGGRIIIALPKGSTFVPKKTLLLNVAALRSNAGEAISGAWLLNDSVRNSGARAVVEGRGSASNI